MYYSCIIHAILLVTCLCNSSTFNKISMDKQLSIFSLVLAWAVTCLPNVYVFVLESLFS